MPLPRQWDTVPEEIARRLGHKRSGRQRAMIADGHLLLILHDVPDKDAQQREGVYFWRQPSGKWESTGKGAGLVTLQAYVEAYELTADSYADWLEKAEDAQDYFDILEQLAPIQHAANSMYNALQAAREGMPDDVDIIDLRDQAYDIERTLSLLYANAKTALDYHIAKKAEHNALLAIESAKKEDKLNALAAFFFPLIALAGVFGMNLKSGLESTTSIFNFWLTLFGGIFLGYIYTRIINR